MLSKIKFSKPYIVALFIIVVVNTTICQYFIIMIERENGVYTYSYIDDPKSVIAEEGMSGLEFNYFNLKKDTTFLKDNPDFFKKQLYRNFTINPFCFWRWWAYFTDERYTLPYISREDVIKNSEKKKKIEKKY